MTAEMKIKFIHIILFIITLITVNGCERDDICIDEITPRLVIRFYNNDNQVETKNANLVSIRFVGIENDSIQLSSVDSIAVPLKVTENLTQYILTINNNDGSINRDTLTVSYERDDAFVGRSCGFKTIFNSTSHTLQTGSENWILNIESTTQTIDNENNAHVKIFH